MSKVKKIHVKNLKAISELEIDFNGCTAIITGGNNKGKSTFLRSIVDRIRGLKPDLIVKQGEKEGSGTMELTTGEKFIWEFDNDGDKLTFVTKEGYKTKVTKEIIARFFPPSFDIDKFLNSAPKEQSKQLQKIVGIDFTEIDNRYKLAYDNRTELNREAERFHVKLASMLEVPKVEPVDLTELQAKKEEIRKKLNELYLANKKDNDELRTKWTRECETLRRELEDFNREQDVNENNYVTASKALDHLLSVSYSGSEVAGFCKQLSAKIQEKKWYKPHPEPGYKEEKPDDSELQEIDKKILSASEINTEAKKYTDYILYKESVDAAKAFAADADILVRAIEDERETMIKSAKMPTGIEFAAEGITVDGFPLDKTQISTSKLYCAALRIASMNLGEVESLHFDASFLDKFTLLEIELWAKEHDLQLLIERAEYDGGEIKYELIES